MASSNDETNRCTPQGVPYSTLPHMVNADGQYLFCRIWEPTLEPGQKPRALLFYSHGFTGHCGRDGSILAELLNKHGFLVFGHDHVGHGQSEGERIYIENIHVLARDLLQHVDMMVAKYPGAPVFVYGFSLGGAASIVATCDRPALFTGMVLAAPAIKSMGLRTYSTLKMTVLWALAKMFPNYVPFGRADQPDLDELRKSGKDPFHFHGGWNLRAVFKALEATLATQSFLQKVECPFLVLHGENDHTNDSSGSTLLHEQASSQDKEIKIYPTRTHNLLLGAHEDPGLACIKQDVLDWLLPRVKTAPRIDLSNI